MDVAGLLSRGGSAASQSAAGRGYPSFRMDFTSLTGQLLSAGITRILPPAPVSLDGHARELGFRCPVQWAVEVARKNLPSRAVIQFDDVALGMGPDPHGAFIPRRRAMRRPIGYFRPDGACAFRLLG